MTTMDTYLLRSFLHVAELGNLSRASERLHISQPALSRQIKQLEENLGVALFERTGRGMRLTQAGELLAERARPLLEQLERLASEVAARAGEVTGQVRLAVPPSFGAGLAADILEAFRVRCPLVEQQVVVALSGAVHDGLLRESLDLGVLYPPIRSQALVTTSLWTEHLDLIGAPGMLEGSVVLADALSRPLLLPSQPHGLRMVVEGAAAREGATLSVVMEVNSLRVLVELLHRGLGFAFLPLRAVDSEVRAGLLSVASVRSPTVERQTVLAWSSERHMTQAVQIMREVLLEQVRRWTHRSSSAV